MKTYTKPACHTPMKLQPGFKVVRLRKDLWKGQKGQMVSATGGPWRRIQYEVGKPAFPQKGCGPLAVFESRKSAETFCIDMMPSPHYSNMAILPCLYAPIRVKSLWHRWPSGELSETRAFNFPRGTEFADAVFLQRPA